MLIRRLVKSVGPGPDEVTLPLDIRRPGSHIQQIPRQHPRQENLKMVREVNGVEPAVPDSSLWLSYELAIREEAYKLTRNRGMGCLHSDQGQRTPHRELGTVGGKRKLFFSFRMQRRQRTPHRELGTVGGKRKLFFSVRTQWRTCRNEQGKQGTQECVGQLLHCSCTGTQQQQLSFQAPQQLALPGLSSREEMAEGGTVTAKCLKGAVAATTTPCTHGNVTF